MDFQVGKGAVYQFFIVLGRMLSGTIQISVALQKGDLRSGRVPCSNSLLFEGWKAWKCIDFRSGRRLSGCRSGRRLYCLKLEPWQCMDFQIGKINLLYM